MKKLLFAMLIATGAMSVQASYLYWRIDDTDITKVTEEATKTETPWDKVTFYAVDSDGNRHQLAYAVNANEDPDDPYNGFTAGQSVNLGEYYTSGYSYYIELVNTATSPNPVLGYSTETYEKLSGSGLVTDHELSPGEITEAKVWHGGSGGYNAPEPTSAMLMLLGVAGLALKRKQKKA